MDGAPREAVFFTRYAANGGSSRTRAYEYVEPLRAHGIAARVVSRVDERGVPDPGAFRAVCAAARRGAVVVVQKPSLTFGQLDEVLAASGGRLAVDFDDAVWMGYGPGDPVDGLPSLEAAVARARLVTTGSAQLAAWARRRAGGTVRVLPPSLDLRRYPAVREHRAVAAPVVCWIGSSGNFRDFGAADGAVAGVLRGLVADGAIRLRVIADRPLDAAQWPGAEWVRWSSGGEAAALAACDVGIMPLVDDERTRGRCGYKALQYQAAGLPVIASPVGGAAETVAAGETGILAATPDEWQTALLSLASTPTLRTRLGTAGRTRVRTHFHLPTTASHLAALLTAMQGREELRE